jgi:hypothetical protein
VATASPTAATVTSTARGRVSAATTAYVTTASIRWSCSASTV